MNFPEKYFETELREGFEVPELMKRAWAAALEVLEVIDNICKNNKIRWFADGGTLLGAIRHAGFIPWDDDIDICMLREDYNKFLEVVEKELPEGFVVAGMYAKEKRLQEAAKVQHLRIIADEEYWKLPNYMNRFHAFPCFRIGIDIFPLDYVNRDEKIETEIYEKYYNMMNLLTHWDNYSKRSDFEEKIDKIEEYFDIKIPRDDKLYNTLWRLSDELISSTSVDDADCVTNYFFKCFYDGKLEIKKDDYDDVIMHIFEFFEIPIPRGYDDVLTAYYGDYMKPVISYDTHEYPFYKKQAAELEKLLKESGITCSLTEFCRNWQIANNL